MNTKCTTCGAPQQLNDLNTCIYCGDILKNENLNENLLKEFIPIKYEYSQQNYSKVVKLADDYLKKDIFNIPCWCYKISSEFFHKSNNNGFYDFSILSNSLKSLLDLKITTSLSQKVIENQITSVLDKIVIPHDILTFRNYQDLENIINENFNSEFSDYCKTKYTTKFFKNNNGNHNQIYNPKDFDPLFAEAAVLIINAQQGSTSLIQRSFKLGYNRSGRIFDQLESAGIIGPSQGSKPREVLIKSKSELNILLSTLGINPIPIIDDVAKEKSNVPNAQSTSKKGCFIATATMGDYNHPIVLDLRYFRDNWLSEQSWGPRFVNWYYKNSPFAAKFIERNKYLRKVVFYILIKPLHFISKKLQ
jgi:hypothetical protein